MLSDRRLVLFCPVCNAGALHCGQTVGQIKMKVGMRVSLGTRHIVLDGDPAPPPQRGTAPIFGPYLLRPNGWMDEDESWHRGRPRLRRLCVIWGPRCPCSTRGWSLPQIFGPFLATVCKTVRPMLSDRRLSVLSSLSCLWRRCIVAKPLDGSRCHLVQM